MRINAHFGLLNYAQVLWWTIQFKDRLSNEKSRLRIVLRRGWCHRILFFASVSAFRKEDLQFASSSRTHPCRMKMHLLCHRNDRFRVWTCFDFCWEKPWKSFRSFQGSNSPNCSRSYCHYRSQHLPPEINHDMIIVNYKAFSSSANKRNC